MFAVYIGLIIFSSLALIILGLLQCSKKENSSGGIVESSSMGKIIGIKETTTTLEKLTLFFVFLVMAMCILSCRELRKSVKVNVSVNAQN